MARLKRVMQTTPTNCFQACVASIFRCPIEEVPQGCDGASWNWDEFQDWLSDRGYQAIEIGFGNGGTIYPVRSPVPCILTGLSPRECKTGRHAVVARLLGLEGFELIHDPHQSGEMISGEPTHAVFFVHTSLPQLKAVPVGTKLDRAVASSTMQCPGGHGCQCCGGRCDCGCRNECPKFRATIEQQEPRQ